MTATLLPAVWRLMMISQPKKFLAASLLGLILVSANIPMVQSFTNARKTTPQTGGSLTFQSTTKMSETSAQIGKALPASQPVLEMPAPAVEEPLLSLPVIVLPEGLEDLIDQVRDGNPEMIRGVFIDGVLSLPVVQQPANDNGFVSSIYGQITEFQSARRNGITGLLAHNYLSGDLFYQVEVDQDIWLIYGDGSFLRYRVVDIQSFQKLTPSSMQSEFIDMANGSRLSTAQVFNRFYSGEHRLTLQTCLARGTLSNWGLTFWTAELVD
jgi:hypothetical protein